MKKEEECEEWDSVSASAVSILIICFKTVHNVVNSIFRSAMLNQGTAFLNVVPTLPTMQLSQTSRIHANT